MRPCRDCQFETPVVNNLAKKAFKIKTVKIVFTLFEKKEARCKRNNVSYAHRPPVANSKSKDRSNEWGLQFYHRIIDDRIEKSIKGRRIGHCAFAASIFKVQRLCQY